MSSPSRAAPPSVLAFAASDPTSGAGVQADLLTIAALGCHPLCVLTAITVQDTRGVEALLSLQPEWVADQARRLLDDIPVAAFKLGVLGSAANVRAVAGILAEHPEVPVVLDPVLASARGDALAGEDAVQALRELIVPLATIATPNSVEARRLASPAASLHDCARRILEDGCDYVLITGTHESTPEVVNTLYDGSGIVREDRWPRLPGSYHGSGCTLASAIAATHANGLEIPQAVRDAQEFTWQSLAAGFRPGRGQLVPDRLFWK
jgi:hydroxymethylpyrimidine/phosphomethylpyrimidine kinase